MRAKEFVTEGKLAKNAKSASTGAHLVRDGQGLDRLYHLNRLAMAMAMADGSDNPLEIDETSWSAKNCTIHPYSELEHKMLKQAMKAVKSTHSHVVRDHKSLEPTDTHHASPVRKNKHVYGKAK